MLPKLTNSSKISNFVSLKGILEEYDASAGNISKRPYTNFES
jgi:hypothetical protein